MITHFVFKFKSSSKVSGNRDSLATESQIVLSEVLGILATVMGGGGGKWPSDSASFS